MTFATITPQQKALSDPKHNELVDGLCEKESCSEETECHRLPVGINVSVGCFHLAAAAALLPTAWQHIWPSLFLAELQSDKHATDKRTKHK